MQTMSYCPLCHMQTVHVSKDGREWSCAGCILDGRLSTPVSDTEEDR